ncbi:Wax ester synthase/diacylglycerol acyltransferase 2 [Linum perenne]
MSIEFYDKCLEDYLANLGMSRFLEGKPLWEVHIIKYPTSCAAGNIIFRLHHSLGDGFSLMGALLSCLQRADNPSLPLTLPSNNHRCSNSRNNTVVRFLSSVANTFSDVCPIFKNNLVADSKSAVRSGHDGIEFLEASIVTMAFYMNDVKQIKTNLGVVRFQFYFYSLYKFNLLKISFFHLIITNVFARPLAGRKLAIYNFKIILRE